MPPLLERSRSREARRSRWDRRSKPGRMSQKPSAGAMRIRGRHAVALEGLFDDCGSVDGVVQCAADTRVAKCRPSRVENDTVDVVSQKRKNIDRRLASNELDERQGQPRTENQSHRASSRPTRHARPDRPSRRFDRLRVSHGSTVRNAFIANSLAVVEAVDEWSCPNMLAVLAELHDRDGQDRRAGRSTGR